jgi:hypothetical protein
MRIRSLTMQNFRGFADASVDRRVLHPVTPGVAAEEYDHPSGRRLSPCGLRHRRDGGPLVLRQEHG